jgi:hypothetical protein
MLAQIYAWLSSIRLTLFLLTASVLLIFFGTLDQVHYGIYHTQQKYFEHVFVIWSYPQQWIYGDALQWFKLPLPGGYFLGPLLVINLACAHFKYFRPSLKKIGIPFIHAGIVLLLLGQLWTQVRQTEYFMWLAEGERGHFVESFHYDEFVITDITDPDADIAYSWHEAALRERGQQLSHPDLPFTIEVLWHARNAAIFQRPPNAAAAFPQMPFDRGIGAENDLVAMAQPPTFAEGERNVTSAIVRLSDSSSGQPIGSWLVSNLFRQHMPMRQPFPHQEFTHGDRTYRVAMRFTRRYLPAEIELRDFHHDRYPGTDIPFNFSSDVRLHEFATGNARDTLIYMNHPLRYAGLTFYQASFADNDTRSMFQVVHNPARWIPYISTAITTIGLIVQFVVSLYFHVYRRRAS